jgi:putative tricarboxylic transport membrane protein
MVTGLVAYPAAAQTGADFYKGKTVTYIVASAAGGGYDLYGRLVAEFMQKHLPGSTIIVKNVPGAGHLVGANTLYASKPDGLTIGIFNTGLIYNQLIGAEGVRFDLTKMSWIGKASSEPRVFIVSPDLPIKNFADLQNYKGTINIATSGPGSASYVETVTLTKALKLPAKILTGYNGIADQLAMRRGEIGGMMGALSSFEAFVKNGYGRPIVQIGGVNGKLPQLEPQVSDPTAKALIDLVQSQGDISKLTAGPPGIPDDRLAALRAAYKAALEDPELKAKVEKLDRPIEAAYGDEVLSRIRRALKQTPETIALLKEALSATEETPSTPATKGAVAEWDGRSKIVLKLDDGKMFESAISGSRTEISVRGQKSARENIKTGMTCSIDGPGGGEAKSISCN